MRPACPSTLFGVKDSPGDLVNAVKDQPFHVLLFEQVDKASIDVIRSFVAIMTQGFYRAPSSIDCSFANTVCFFTTSKAVSQLQALASHRLNERMWNERALEAVASETAIEPTFLNATSGILLFEPPSEETKAEVVVMAMQREAAAHGLVINHVRLARYRIGVDSN